MNVPGARLAGLSAILALAAAPVAAQTISHVKTVTFGVSSLAAAGGTIMLDVPAGGVAAGNTLIISISTTGSGSSVMPTATDSKGNAYSPVFAHSVAGSRRVSLIRSAVTTSLLDADTISISWAAFTETTAGVLVAQVDEFANIVAVSPLDLFEGASGTGTTPSVTDAGPTSQANELVLGAFGSIGNTTFTAGAGYTALPPTCFIAGAGTLTTCIYVEFKVVNAIGGQTADGTFLNSLPWVGALATFRDEVVSVELQTFRVDD
ncbi:MAG TPA: hypothetical protein VFE44_06020 [Thermoanaerobaculia bacterium]|nr:hypothetical protein [Thermoanaerobaculia bacterium]